MGVKDLVVRANSAMGDFVAKASALSPEQLADVQRRRSSYLSEMPDPNDSTATELTERLLGACGIEIHNAFLSRIDDAYVPVDPTVEYENLFDAQHNVRHLNITKWVIDPEENSLEKLINVYEVLADEDCNIALVFNRTCRATNVYLAVVNAKNSTSNVDVDNCCERIAGSLRGNFPGSEIEYGEPGRLPCISENRAYSVAAISNIPTEKSEKFALQTIEKLLDGEVPEEPRKEYTLILLATPIQDVEERKLRLSALHTALAPYAGWQTQFQYNQSDSVTSSATLGVNAGVSAGVQNGVNAGVTNTDSTTDSSGSSVTNSTGTNKANTKGRTRGWQKGWSKSTTGGVSATEGMSVGASVGTSESVSVGVPGASASASVNASVNTQVNASLSESLSTTGGTSGGESLAEATSSTIGETVGRAVANTLGKAVTSGVSKTVGLMSSTNLGANFGASFARSSSVTATIGKSEGIIQTFTNYTIKHALETLEKQMLRLDQASALGMWDFAAYVLGEDFGVVTNVAHSYLALTQGEESYVSQAAVNRWRGDLGEASGEARTICNYLRDLRHPFFALDPALLERDESFAQYPATVTPTTALSGKELAYSLNFPNSSVPGLPVIECAEFGRNVVTFEGEPIEGEGIRLGNVFHMHRTEPVEVELDVQSLAAHTFITGSTGAGKTNTVCKILDEAEKSGVRFLVVEPAKGEYKDIYGGRSDVHVFGTNANVAPLLHLDPFSFPEGVHVLEHLDRLVEVFNVCWPMYAAMPAVLKDAIQRSYEDCGWDLAESVNPFGERLFPSFADVARNVRAILDSSEYDAENKGAYKGSLLTRLNSLTNGINGRILTSNETTPEVLFDSNVVVDLSRVGSTETKSLLMGLLVLKLQEYRMATSGGTNLPLRHLSVLEEAHNLLKRTSTEQPVEGGNLLGKSVEMLSNAIAEMRTYGEGFVIADQAPGLLDMAVIRNTNTKIIMRLPDYSDRELVGKAANLSDSQIIEIARLPMGVAAVYQNNWIQPVLCKVDKSSAGTPFTYKREAREVSVLNAVDCLLITELLAYGTRVTGGLRLNEVQAAMDRIGLSSYMRVSILRALKEPPTEPRMTQLAPIMSALFPAAREAMKRVHQTTSDNFEWTGAVDRALDGFVQAELDDLLRRVIVQGVITDYLLNELRDEKALREWSRVAFA